MNEYLGNDQPYLPRNTYSTIELLPKFGIELKKVNKTSGFNHFSFFVRNSSVNVKFMIT